MNETIITIVGTKGAEQKDSDFTIYSKDQTIERINELLDEGYGYSVIQARKWLHTLEQY